MILPLLLLGGAVALVVVMKSGVARDVSGNPLASQFEPGQWYCGYVMAKNFGEANATLFVHGFIVPNLIDKPISGGYEFTASKFEGKKPLTVPTVIVAYLTDSPGVQA